MAERPTSSAAKPPGVSRSFSQLSVRRLVGCGLQPTPRGWRAIQSSTSARRATGESEARRIQSKEWRS